MREKLIDAIVDMAGDEIETPQDMVKYAKMSDEQLVDEVINIAEYYRRESNESTDFEIPERLIACKTILFEMNNDLKDYKNQKGIGTMSDVEWGDLFIERITASLMSYENLWK